MAREKTYLLFVSLVVILGETNLLLSRSAAANTNDDAQIGVIFETGFDRRTKIDFQLAIERSSEKTGSKTRFLIDTLEQNDILQVSETACKQFSNGALALFASAGSENLAPLISMAKTFHVPLLTPSLLPSILSGMNPYVMSLHPDYQSGIREFIEHSGWERVSYLCDSEEGLARMEKLLWQNEKSANSTVFLEDFRRVSSSQEALNFLQELESRNRWSEKYVVMDLEEGFAKELIGMLEERNSIEKRNFHFLFSSLVLDSFWRNPEGLSTLDITSFRLVDTSRPFVEEYLESRKEHSGIEHEFISSESALVFDSVMVLTEAVTRYQRKNPLVAQKVLCGLDGSTRQIFEEGNAFARIIRKVKMEGLTGEISFNSAGLRNHFSLEILQTNIGTPGTITKIGTWSDTHGLRIFPREKPYSEFFAADKTYVVTSILEKPFLMHNEQNELEGYALDLAELLSGRIGFKYTVQLVKDNAYGMQSPAFDGGWNGMIGELVRNEVDIAIAPLSITSSREKAIAFSNPFMTQGITILMKKPDLASSTAFNVILSPFSNEVWICIAFTFVGVFLVLFFDNKFSYQRWKLRVSSSEQSCDTASDVSFFNNIWFTMGAVCQQGSDAYPRTVFGRVISSVWFIFLLFVVSAYTANLAAFLTAHRMNTFPIHSVDDLSRQTTVEYGLRDGGSTKEFFKNSRVETYERMWEFMSAREDSLAKTTAEGISRVRNSDGRYAFFIESSQGEYINGQPPCDTYTVGHTINSNGYGIATPKHSPLMNALNMAILELREDGTLDELKDKWWVQKSECLKDQDHNMNASSLTLGNFSGVFYVLIGGLVVATVVAVVELFKARSHSSKNKFKVSDAMNAKERVPIFDNNEPTMNQKV